MAHPADETTRSILLHGVVPALSAIAALAVSILADLVCPGTHWTQRAGSIVTILGAYVAFVGTRRSFKVIDGSLYMNFALPYALISIALIVVGTLIWGYADIFL